MARPGHSPRPAEAGPYGRSGCAALPDITDTTGQRGSPTVPLAGDAADGACRSAASSEDPPPGHTEETATHPALSYQLAASRVVARFPEPPAPEPSRSQDCWPGA